MVFLAVSRGTFRKTISLRSQLVSVSPYVRLWESRVGVPGRIRSRISGRTPIGCSHSSITLVQHPQSFPCHRMQLALAAATRCASFLAAVMTASSCRVA